MKCQACKTDDVAAYDHRAKKLICLGCGIALLQLSEHIEFFGDDQDALDQRITEAQS